MFSKIIVEQNLIDLAITDTNLNIPCIIKVESGNNFDEIFYRDEYEYHQRSYLGPISYEQQQALSMLDQKSIFTVLDIGGGSGYIAQWLNKKKFEVTVCEIDAYALAICRGRGLNRLINDSYHMLNTSFDAAVMMGGSIGITSPVEPEVAVRDCAMHLSQIVKSKGYILTDLSYYELPMFTDNHKYKVASVRLGIGDNWTDPSYHVYPHPTIFSSAMKEYGCELIQQSIIDIGSHHESIQQRLYSLWQRID